MMIQRTYNGQNKFEKQEQSCRAHTTWFQNLQIYNNQESIELA